MNIFFYLIGIAYALIGLFKPKLATQIFIAFSIFQLGWLDRYVIVGAELGRISLIFGIILMFRIVLDLISKRKRILKTHRFLKPLIPLGLIYLLITLLSNYYNNESIILGLYSLRYYIIGYTACLSLYFYNRSSLSIIRLKRLLIILGLIQIPFSIVKYIHAGGGALQTLDSVTGTFSGYGELVGCQLLCVGILIYDKLKYSKNTLKINNYLLSLVLISPLILSKSRTASALIAIIPLFAFFLYAIHSKDIVKNLGKAIFIIALSLVIWILFYNYFWLVGYDVEEQLSSEYIYGYFMREAEYSPTRTVYGAGLGRMMAIIKATDTVTQNPFNLLFGFGSGSTQEAIFLRQSGNYYEEYGEFAGIGRNQYSRIIFEYGFVGLMALMAFLLHIKRSISRAFRGTIRKILNDTFAIYLFVLIVMSWYSVTFSSNFFSILLGGFIAVFQAEQDHILTKKSKENIRLQNV